MAESQLSSMKIDDNGEESECIGEKYNSLLKASSTVGTHFRFTIEKRWNDTKNLVMPSYFVLNLESVAENLSKIPFFERQQINKPSVIHDSAAKRSFTTCSRYNKNSLEKCLETAELLKDLKYLNVDENMITNQVQLTDKDERENIHGNEDSSSMCCVPTKSDESKDNVLLDDWLDSVLDD